MNVDALVAKWMDVIPRMCLAHNKEESDEAEAAVEEMLNPILAAPIKQCREFVGKIAAAMEADPRVPWVVWSTFGVWQKNFEAAPDEKVKRLKKKLAAEIVELVEEDVRPDLGKAMIRALMWRDEETLQEIKAATIDLKKRGGRVRAVGRESCLFLQVPRGSGRKRAEVML